MFEDVRGRDRDRIRRDLRRLHLKQLGWTIVTDNSIYAPGEDPDEASVIWNLATAARSAGLPMDLDELYQWGRDRARRRAEVQEADPSQPEAARSTNELELLSDAERDAAVVYAPVERHLTERARVPQDAMEREALRFESGLVWRFASYLGHMGHETSSIVIHVDHEVIRADLFDNTDRVLYEAKAAPERQKIRMAIGQLLDYARFIVPEPRLRVLVPAEPNHDLCRLLAVARIGATWPENEGWRHFDPAALDSRPGNS
jgi:hypothetical protein